MSEKKVSRRDYLKYVAGVAVVAAVAGVGYGAYEATKAPPGPAAVTETATATVTAPATVTAAKGIIAGFNVGTYGWPWRTQLIDDFETIAEEYKATGTIREYYMTASGAQISDEISDIGGLVQKGVNLIVIDPNSADALNSAIAEAHDKGIIVCATDQNVTSPDAYNVVIDQKAWFADITKWVCDQLNGKGNVVVITGIPTQSANVARMDGAHEVLAGYPGIKVLREIEGDWSFDTAEKNFAPVLAQYRGQIDAILSEDGMMLGILSAYDAAGIKPTDKDFPKIWTGDYTLASLRKWQDLINTVPGFKCYMRLNTPGYGADALRIGVRLAQGRKLNMNYAMIDTKTYPGTTLWLPLPPAITNDDVAPYLKEYNYKPETYQVDYIITEDDAEKYFLPP